MRAQALKYLAFLDLTQHELANAIGVAVRRVINA